MQLKEALLCKGEQCNLCYRRCKIKDVGYCRTRINIDGKIYTLTYGNLSAIEMRPMEIKPFFHFYVGKKALTFSSYSCNFRCPWCQNWHISMQEPSLDYEYISPDKLVNENGLCASFNEPTLLFEYCIDLFKISKNKNNSMVSNGYMTKEALYMLREAGLNAINIDIKGDEEVYKRYLNAKEEYVWKNVEYAKKIGLHVEVVNLIIPGVNDKEEQIDSLIEKHLKFADEYTPIHFTRYFPAYKFKNPPTPIEKLEYAYKKAKKEGILYPYIGNVPGHEYENTYCHKCGKLIIKRFGNKVIKNYLEGNKCPFCKEILPFIN